MSFPIVFSRFNRISVRASILRIQQKVNRWQSLRSRRFVLKVACRPRAMRIVLRSMNALQVSHDTHKEPSSYRQLLLVRFLIWSRRQLWAFVSQPMFQNVLVPETRESIQSECSAYFYYFFFSVHQFINNRNNERSEKVDNKEPPGYRVFRAIITRNAKGKASANMV